MRLFADLPDARWMYLKAVLFLVAGVVSAAVLLLESPDRWRTAFLLYVTVWSFSRLYYFAFYVIEKYIDPAFRFDGLGSFALYLWKHHGRTLSQTKTPAVREDSGRSVD